MKWNYYEGTKDWAIEELGDDIEWLVEAAEKCAEEAADIRPEHRAEGYLTAFVKILRADRERQRD